MSFACPKCHSENTQKLSIIYGAGTSGVDLRTVGAGVASGLGVGAAAVVSGKHAGKSLRQQLRSLDKTVPASYSIERRNLTQIVKAIYTQPWAKALSEDGAYASFKAECDAQQ